MARSNLLKCAIHGEDPNWGRVLGAVGTTDAAFEPEHLAVAINGVWVCRDGAAGEDRDKVDLSARDGRRSPSTSAPAPTRRRSGPTTSPPPTSTRTRRTRHEGLDMNRHAKALEKASVLVEALPWLERFHGRPSWSSTAATR